jgi:hypothetical protein
LAAPPALIDHFRTSFSGLHSVFLLIRPSGTSTPPLAGLFVGSPGQDAGDVPDLRFLFDPQELNRAPEPAIAEPAEIRHAAVDAPSPAPRPQPKIEQRAPVPASPQKKTGRGLRIAVLAGILTVIAAGAYLVPKLIFRAAVPPQSVAVATFGTSQRHPETGTLGMKVNIETGGLRITWDQKSPRALAAVHGTLQIRDGQKFRDVSLNQAEIQHGNVIYLPQSDDLDLRLELVASDMTRYTDYIKVVGSAMPESRAFPQSREPVISLPPVSSKSAPTAPRPQNARSRTVARPFTPPHIASRQPVPQPSLPAPPQLTDVERAAHIANPGPLTTSHIASPQPPVSDRPAASAPVTPSSAPINESLRPTAQRAISKVTDPVLRKKTPVNLPSDLRKLAGNMIVMLRVTIDSDGHVLRTQPMGDKAGFKHNIALIVANSVRNWEFRPGEADGKPVRSDFDLQVVIRADGGLRQ